MKLEMNRRDFLKYSIGGMATLAVGSGITRLLGNTALAQVQIHTLNVTITDAIKNMVTNNNGTTSAQCYFWIYKMDAVGADGTEFNIQPEVPGPIIIMSRGDTIDINITNNLDEPHSFVIPGIFDSGTIAANGGTFSGTIDTTSAPSGAHLYHDDLNAPVNRVMGLHGAFIVMPAAAAAGHKFTPYDNPTPGVQKLFDDFGDLDPVTGLGSTHYAGLAWEQGDPGQDTFALPFRQYVWVLHQPSPNLFNSVGNNENISFTTTSGETVTGSARDPVVFTKAFLHDRLDPLNPVDATGFPANNVPQYFTISGQSGHLSHDNPFITPELRAGEPCVVHVLNAGLWSHSMHLHANHFYVTIINGVVQINPVWVDVFNIEPMDMIDYIIPFMRPPSVPNIRGIGNVDIPGGADGPLTSLANPRISGSTPHPVWPPIEEIATFIPKAGEKAGDTNIEVQLSPLCYPMHDHSEPSQTAQGGNYNMGMISGMIFTGDRNTPGRVTTFPNAPKVSGPDRTKLLQDPAGGAV